jgi:DNA-3-methyladenine glycosylase II
MEQTKQFLSKQDPILANIITQIPVETLHCNVSIMGDVFHDMVSCIIEQQIHYRSTKKIFKKALERAGIEHVTLDNFHLLEEHSLPQIKLAIGKYETLLAFVEYWSNNGLDFENLTDEEVIAQLSTIKGIGKWTIDMILLYTLQRPNVFPYDDFHLKEIMVKLYGLDPNVKLKAQMIYISNGWGEDKSLAVKYLLAWKEFNKKSQK